MAARRVLALLALVILAGCPDGGSAPATSPSVELTVRGAASLGEPLRRLATAFEGAHPGTRVLVSTGSSTALERQVENGAPCDVFVAAAAGPLDRLLEAKLLDPTSRRVVARNELVVIVPRGSRAPADLEALAGFERVAVGQKGVPVGDYAREALAAARLAERLSGKLAGYPDEPSVVTAVAEGGSPVGIVYGSSLVAHARREAIARAFAIDPRLHAPIVYPAATTADPARAAHARAFLDFVASEPGRRELAALGFLPGAPP